MVSGGPRGRPSGIRYLKIRPTPSPPAAGTRRVAAATMKGLCSCWMRVRGEISRRSLSQPTHSTKAIAQSDTTTPVAAPRRDSTTIRNRTVEALGEEPVEAATAPHPGVSRGRSALRAGARHWVALWHPVLRRVLRRTSAHGPPARHRILRISPRVGQPVLPGRKRPVCPRTRRRGRFRRFERAVFESGRRSPPAQRAEPESPRPPSMSHRSNRIVISS